MFTSLYSRPFHSATIPQPHTAASPVTLAATLNKRSHHLTTQMGCSLKGCYSHILNLPTCNTHVHSTTVLICSCSICSGPVRATVILSTWTTFVFTTKLCRNKQLILSVAAPLVTLIPPARFCFQHSGISPQTQSLSMLCRFFAYFNLSLQEKPWRA